MIEKGHLPRRLETDAESVERDLMKLILTIVELVRQLMERQALRRVDEGDLDRRAGGGHRVCLDAARNGDVGAS